MNNITYILPIHEYNTDVKGMLTKALNSLKEMTSKGNVIVIGPKKVLEKVDKIYGTVGCKQKITLIENDETNFYIQVNKAVMHCRTKYFCVFEYDDMFTPNWVKDFSSYEGKYSVYIPLNEAFKEEGDILSFINEIVWSASFTEEDKLGYITIDNLKDYKDYNLTGAIIKTEDFISVGGLKPSLKIASWYEFLHRVCYNSMKIFVIPKVGYQHRIDREGSYWAEANKEITKEEGRWLIKKAQQEYFFKEDRNISFEKDGQVSEEATTETDSELPIENEELK